jgi:hypothetical protein
MALVAIVAIAEKTRASGDATQQPAQATVQYPATPTEMKHYESSEWNFAIEIPKRWNAFPPVSSNSPFEVMRFMSREDGVHNLIVFRQPSDPKQTAANWEEGVQRVLAKGGFGNFVVGKTTIGSREVLTLDFDKPAPNGGTWSCRHYFVADGTLAYVLGFGSSNKAGMFGLYDQMAKSFQILDQ